MVIWMRFVALLVCTLECLGKARGGSGSQDTKLDKEVMKRFSNFLYRESSRLIDGEGIDDENERGQLSMDLATSFFWGQEKGVVMEVGALDGVRLSESRPLLDLNWRRILVEGSPVYGRRMNKNSPDALNFNAAICRNNRTSNQNDSFHYGKTNCIRSDVLTHLRSY